MSEFGSQVKIGVRNPLEDHSALSGFSMMSIGSTSLKTTIDVTVWLSPTLRRQLRDRLIAIDGLPEGGLPNFSRRETP